MKWFVPREKSLTTECVVCTVPTKLMFNTRKYFIFVVDGLPKRRIFAVKKLLELSLFINKTFHKNLVKSLEAKQSTMAT